MNSGVPPLRKNRYGRYRQTHVRAYACSSSTQDGWRGQDLAQPLKKDLSYLQMSTIVTPYCQQTALQQRIVSNITDVSDPCQHQACCIHRHILRAALIIGASGPADHTRFLWIFNRQNCPSLVSYKGTFAQ